MTWFEIVLTVMSDVGFSPVVGRDLIRSSELFPARTGRWGLHGVGDTGLVGPRGSPGFGSVSNGLQHPKAEASCAFASHASDN